MKQQARNSLFTRLAIIAAVILAVIGIGYALGALDRVFTILKAVGLLLLGITILVTIHELGHFLPAKWFGMRVDIFSIGFPPKLFGFKRGETEYQIGATPLGGYVKIAGMIDESLDRDTIEREKAREQQDQDWKSNAQLAPQPWEFRAKPVWQRLIVMLGGVTMNVILGVLIFSSLKYIYGEERTPINEVEYGVYVQPGVKSIGSLIGFQAGDSLVSFNGESHPYFEDYLDVNRLLADDAYYEVMRDGKVVRLDVRPDIQDFLDTNEDSVAPLFIFIDIPATIYVPDSIPIQSPEDKKKVLMVPSQASLAGLQTGDEIIGLDQQPINRYSQVLAFMFEKRAHQQLNQPIDIQVLRAGDTMSFSFQPGSGGYLGVNQMMSQYIERETIDFGIGGAIAAGAKTAFGAVSTNFKGFKNMAQGEASVSKSLKGPIQIAGILLESFERGGFRAFLGLTGMLSMILAFVNILPIPALDGGHVVFLLIEGITRREPSVKVRLIAQQIGMVLVLGLMVFVLLNDTIQSFN